MSDAAMNHLTDEELHAAAENRLDAADATQRHLDSCAACRTEVDRIRGLLEHVATLPREIEPPVDLYAGIRERIHAPRRAVIGRGMPPRMYLWLAAAAVLLIIASSAVTTLILRGGDQPIATDHDGQGGGDSLAGAAAFRTVSEEYDRLDRDVAATLAAQREKLLPETVEKVERNLAIIDQAIREIRQALAEDPNNKALQQLLKASYGQKAALLRQVSQS